MICTPCLSAVHIKFTFQNSSDSVQFRSPLIHRANDRLDLLSHIILPDRQGLANRRHTHSWTSVPAMPVPAHELRELQAVDSELFDSVVALVNECYRGEGSWTTEAGLVSGARTTREGLLGDMRGMTMLVALGPLDKDDGQVQLLGCVKTGLVTSTVVGPLKGGGKAAYLGMLAVDRRVKSRGLASALVDAVEKRAVATNVDKVVMDVLDCRVELLDWYERMGYVRTGERRDAQDFFHERGERLFVENVSFIVLEKALPASVDVDGAS
jgi:ribosomal protein S18 acetylase RimI-like enzyme